MRQLKQIDTLFKVQFTNYNELTNPNQASNNESKSPQFYITKIQKLQKRLHHVTQQLRKPLNYILPPDFQQKFQESKNHSYFDNHWIQTYKEMIAYMIQGQINISLMGLTQKFIQQFGGSVSFWMDLICQLSQNQKYDETLRIWHINDQIKACLPLPLQQYQKIKKLRKLAKTDICTSRNLLTILYQLKSALQNPLTSKKKPEQLQQKLKKMQEKHEQSDKKFTNFLKQYQQVLNNIEFLNKKVSLYRSTTLDKFKKVQHTNQQINSRSKRETKQMLPLKQKAITQFSNLPYTKCNNLLQKISNVQKKPSSQPNFSVLQSQLSHISHPLYSVSFLRQQFVSINYHLILHPSVGYYSNVGNVYEGFFYQNFIVTKEESAKVHFAKPFLNLDFVNYQIDDDDFYLDFQASDLQNTLDQQDTQDSQLNSQQINQLLDFDDAYQMSDDQFQMHHIAISLEKVYNGSYWVYNSRNSQQVQLWKSSIAQKNTITQLSQFNLLPLYQIYLNDQIPMTTSDQDFQKQNVGLLPQQIQRLKQIVNMRTKRQIQQIIQQDQNLRNQISKKNLKDFLNKKTKKQRKKINGKHVQVYILNVQQLNHNQNIQKLQIQQPNNHQFSQPKQDKQVSIKDDKTVYEPEKQLYQPIRQKPKRNNRKRLNIDEQIKAYQKLKNPRKSKNQQELKSSRKSKDSKKSKNSRQSNVLRRSKGQRKSQNLKIQRSKQQKVRKFQKSGKQIKKNKQIQKFSASQRLSQKSIQDQSRLSLVRSLRQRSKKIDYYDSPQKQQLIDLTLTQSP